MLYVIFGSTGMLGSYCVQYLTRRQIPFVAFDRTHVDARTTSVDALVTLFREHILKNEKKVIVINALGIIRQRSGITLPEMMQVNVFFPYMLALATEQMDYKMIQISTDCVFNGVHLFQPAGAVHRPYDEHCKPNEAFDPYGISKRLAEQLLFLNHPPPLHLTVIRTSIIGEENRNKLSLLEWLRSQAGKTVSGFQNHFWNGVTCLQLIKTIVDTTSQLTVCDLFFWGSVRHVYSPDTVSKYQLLQLINDAYELKCTVNATDHEKTLKKDLTSILSDSKVYLDKIPPLKQQLKELKEFSSPSPSPSHTKVVATMEENKGGFCIQTLIQTLSDAQRLHGGNVPIIFCSTNTDGLQLQPVHHFTADKNSVLLFSHTPHK